MSHFYINESTVTEKSGVHPDNVNDLVSHVMKNCPHLNLLGLMTIGAFDHDLSQGPNPDFQVGERSLSVFFVRNKNVWVRMCRKFWNF